MKVSGTVKASPLVGCYAVACASQTTIATCQPSSSTLSGGASQWVTVVAAPAVAPLTRRPDTTPDILASGLGSPRSVLDVAGEWLGMGRRRDGRLGEERKTGVCWQTIQIRKAGGVTGDAPATLPTSEKDDRGWPASR